MMRAEDGKLHSQLEWPYVYMHLCSMCMHACMCCVCAVNVCVCMDMCVCTVMHACMNVQGRREGGGQLGHFALGPTLLMGPKRSIYSNRTVKYSIKAVTTYILPWAPQALWAAL